MDFCLAIFFLLLQPSTASAFCLVQWAFLSPYQVPTMLKIWFIVFLCYLLTLSPNFASDDGDKFCSSFAEGLAIQILKDASYGAKKASFQELMRDKDMRKKFVLKLVEQAKKMVKELTGLQLLEAELLELQVSHISANLFTMQLRTNLTGKSSSRGISKGVLPGDMYISLVMFTNTEMKVLKDSKNKVKLSMQKCKITEPRLSLATDKPGIDVVKTEKLLYNTFNLEKLVTPLMCPAIQKMIGLLSKSLQHAVSKLPLSVLGTNPVETVSSLLRPCVIGIQDNA
uniref:Uncharacterized protein LOC117345639 isoform X2 n=1 Tax=Geotrypetes seraphini TaxID=260995 RepID=A0A6P8P5T8_GEOSA|nr:uncharacterized protein LOC117345639 isoform X2 [Geotrypetes seraphini]